MRQYVNIYLHDMSYGGPEGGGWWYDTYVPVSSTATYTQEELEAVKKRAEEEVERKNHKRPPVNSMMSVGRYTVQVEDLPAVSRPSLTPDNPRRRVNV